MLGEPDWLYRRVPHPIVLIGRAIAVLEAWLLDPARSDQRKRWSGILLLTSWLGRLLALGLGVELALQPLSAGWLAEGC